MAEREKEVISQVPVVYRERLENIIQEYRDIFPEQLPKGTPPRRVVEHVYNVEPGSKPSYRPPYRLGPAEQDELEEQIRDLPGSRLHSPLMLSVWGACPFCPKEGWAMADVCGLQGVEQADYQGPLSAAADRSAFLIDSARPGCSVSWIWHRAIIR